MPGRPAGFLRPWLTRHRKRQRRRYFDEVCDVLSTLLCNGFPLTEALSHLRKMYAKAAASLIDDAIVRVNSGDRLTAAWQDDLPPLGQCVLEAGEQAGEIGRALALWRGYVLQRREKTEAALRTLTYPALLCLILLALVCVVAKGVIPAFSGMYATMGLRVPDGTRLVFALFRWGWLCLPGLAALGGGSIAFVWYTRRKSLVGWSRIRRCLPLYSLLWTVRTGQFGRLLRLLMDSGIPLVDALTVLSDQAGPQWLSPRVKQMRAALLEGKRLSDTIQPEWDPLLLLSIRLAEASGDLQQSLKRMCLQLDSDVVRRLTLLLRRAEPVLLLTLGGIVSLLLFGVFAPMYQLAAQLASAPINGGVS